MFGYGLRIAFSVLMMRYRILLILSSMLLRFLVTPGSTEQDLLSSAEPSLPKAKSPSYSFSSASPLIEWLGFFSRLPSFFYKFVKSFLKELKSSVIFF
jgi:hypothetical protein